MVTVFRITCLFFGIITLLSALIPSQALAYETASLSSVHQQSALLASQTKKYDFEAVLQLPESEWQKSPLDVLNFSMDQNEHWLRIQLKNNLDTTQQLVLLLDQPLQDYIDFWETDNTGRLRQHVRTGDRREFSSRPLDIRAFAFPIDLTAKESTTLYIRLDTEDGLYEAIPFQLMALETYRQWVISDSLWYGFYYGALIILLIYNLIIALLTRERDFYLYSFYLGFFFIWNIAFRGYAQQFLWPENTWIANQIIALASSAIFISLSFFTAAFLNLRSKTPRMFRLILALTALQLIPVTMALMGYYAQVFSLMIPAASLQLLVILGVAGYRAIKGSRSARIFTLAWAILITSVLIYYAQVMAIIPANSVTSNSLNIGSLIEMLVLALAMVDKINQLKRQQTRALEANLRLQQENNTQLEQLVEEKTAQLTELNKQLKQDAITDALTGLFNRRRLPRLYEKRLEHCRQHDEFIGFILLDIDHFKQVNDSFGHQDGDQVLIALAKCMRDFWREWQADLFRFGGEEFGVIICHKSRQTLSEAIETFQKKIGHQTLHHSCNITASVGAVIMPSKQCPNLDSVIAAADNLLYAAKNQGRDLCLIEPLDNRSDIAK